MAANADTLPRALSTLLARRPAACPTLTRVSLKSLWSVIRVAITVAIFAWVVRRIDGPAAWQALRQFDGSALAAGLLLIAADRQLMMQRWRLLVRPSTDLPDAELTRIFYVSSFIGSFLPAGVGGDAARAYAVGRHLGNSGPALASVVVDRWLGLLAVAISGCGGLLVSLHLVPDAARTLVVVATVLLLAGSLVGMWADRLATSLMPPAALHTRPGRIVMRLATAIGDYRRHGGLLGRVMALSFVVQAVRILLAWSIGYGLGLTLPLKYYWVFMPLNILVILLPLSMGGFGLPQGTMIWTLGPLGVDPTRAFLLSTLFVAAGIVGNIPGAWMYLTGSRTPART